MNSNKAYQKHIDHIFINQFMVRFSFLGEIPIFGYGNWFLDLFNNGIFLKYPPKRRRHPYNHHEFPSIHPSIHPVHCRLTASLLSNTFTQPDHQLKNWEQTNEPQMDELCVSFVITYRIFASCTLLVIINERMTGPHGWISADEREKFIHNLDEKGRRLLPSRPRILLSWSALCPCADFAECCCSCCCCCCCCCWRFVDIFSGDLCCCCFSFLRRVFFPI